MDRAAEQDGEGSLHAATVEAKEQSKSIARDVAESGKSAAAEEIGSLATGIRRSAEGWDDHHAWVRQCLGSAAEGLERLSTTLRDKDVGTLVSEAEAMARRNPALFAAGCAAAGFAMVRFLKSSKKDAA